MFFTVKLKGLPILLLTWTDGLSTVPVINAIVASSKIICSVRNDIDKRTHGAKRYEEDQEKKNILAVKQLKEALNSEIIASYVLYGLVVYRDTSHQRNKKALSLFSLSPMSSVW